MSDQRIEADVVAIGAGQASVPLVRALAAKGQAAVLIERAALGGCCVNYGCTPTKAALASARRAADARSAGALGVRVGDVDVDFAAVIGRARHVALDSRRHLDGLFDHGPARLVRGHARLWGRSGDRFRVVVDDGPEILARTMVIDTGSRTVTPPVPGLDAVPAISAETWLDHDHLPAHLIMLGGGPIGLEMAQFYRRMGAAVTILDTAERLCAGEDDRVSRAITDALEHEGIEVRTGVRVRSAEAIANGVRLTLESGEVAGTHLFLATGRRPAIAELGLDSIGLAPGAGGIIEVDDQLRTHVPGVFAAGDVRGGRQLTSTAWDDHRILLSVLADGEPHTRRRIEPRAIFTDPEIARVGLNEREAAERRLDVRCACLAFSSVAKAVQDGREAGFVSLVADAAGDRLLGATIVGENAAELIHLLALLMEVEAPLAAIERGVYVHPTLSEGVQSAVTALRAGS